MKFISHSMSLFRAAFPMLRNFHFCNIIFAFYGRGLFARMFCKLYRFRNALYWELEMSRGTKRFQFPPFSMRLRKFTADYESLNALFFLGLVVRGFIFCLDWCFLGTKIGIFCFKWSWAPIPTILIKRRTFFSPRREVSMRRSDSVNSRGILGAEKRFPKKRRRPTPSSPSRLCFWC